MAMTIARAMAASMATTRAAAAARLTSSAFRRSYYLNYHHNTKTLLFRRCISAVMQKPLIVSASSAGVASMFPHVPEPLTAGNGQGCASFSSSSSSSLDVECSDPAVDEPVVSSHWLHRNLNNPHVKVIDASWYLPNEQRNPLQEYQDARIPGAVFFDVDKISDQNSSLPHMLPSERAFSAAVSALGINNEDKVIVYDGKGIFSSARVWWMFRLFGHDNVWVLDGGLRNWRSNGYEVESSASDGAILKVMEASDAIDQVHQGKMQLHSPSFITKFRPQLVWSLEQVKLNIEDKRFQHIDARGKARFDGTAPEPRKGVRSGHVPGSKCVPFNEVLNESQELLDSSVLVERFTKEGVSLESPIVASCGTGVTACVLALALHRLGKGDVAVYDGSWTEWGSHPDTPVDVSANTN